MQRFKAFRSGFKTSHQVQAQGAGRFEKAQSRRRRDEPLKRGLQHSRWVLDGVLKSLPVAVSQDLRLDGTNNSLVRKKIMAKRWWFF
jgi:hypothetical protein